MAAELSALSSSAERLAARLEILRRTDLLGQSAEPTFDRLCKFATRLLDVPVSLVTVVDADRQHFKGSQGLPEPWATRRQTPLSHSFCRHVVDAGRPLVIPDARGNPLVCDNPAIVELGVRAYLGVPLSLPGGQVLGSFCVIDHAPRSWAGDDVRTMQELATVASREIGLRLANADLRRDAVGQRLLAQVSAALASSLDEGTKLIRVAHLVVPELADRCYIDVPDDDRQGRCPWGADTTPLQLLLGSHWERLRSEVMRAGRPRLVPDPTGATTDLPGGDVARALDAAGIRSLMVVPLMARERTLGSVTLLSVESRRQFEGADLALAVELAGSIGQALSNARLHREAVGTWDPTAPPASGPGRSGAADRVLAESWKKG
jgi:GAF domain-containing protein